MQFFKNLSRLVLTHRKDQNKQCYYLLQETRRSIVKNTLYKSLSYRFANNTVIRKNISERRLKTMKKPNAPREGRRVPLQWQNSKNS